MPENILDQILQTKRKEVEELHSRHTLAELKESSAKAPRVRNFYAAVTKQPRRKVNLIAEIKQASPSAGLIRRDFDPPAIARAYAQAGADAISVLTDEQYFKGRLDYIQQVRSVVDLPILRKDFIIDPYQVYQSRSAGADAILLIAAALPVGQLIDLVILASQLRLTVLLEVHSAQELEQVKFLLGFPHSAYVLLGLNNRDLRSFQVDLNTSVRLAGLAGPDVPIVSESGIGSPADIQLLARAGVKAVLVGQNLMSQSDIPSAVESLMGPETANQ